MVYFFQFAAIAALYPFFPLLLQEKGFSEPQVGFMLGSYEIFSIGGLLFIGHIYDRFRSPRRTISYLNIATICLLFLFVISRSFLYLIPLALGVGFFVKSPASLVDAHFGQNIPDSSASYGKARLFGSLGFFACSLTIQITGWVNASRPESIFQAFSLCLLASTTLILSLPRAEQSAPHHRKQVKVIETVKTFPRIYWIGLGIVILNYIGMSGHYSFFSLLMKNKFGIGDIGGFWAIGPLGEVPLFFFSAWFLRKLGYKGLWAIALGASFIRMQVYALSPTILPLYIVQILHSLSFGFNHMSMLTLISEKTAPESRGMAMGIFTAAGMGLSLFIGGILGGLILKFSGYTLLFQVFSLFPLVGLGLLLTLGRRRQPAAD